MNLRRISSKFIAATQTVIFAFSRPVVLRFTECALRCSTGNFITTSHYCRCSRRNFRMIAQKCGYPLCKNQQSQVRFHLRNTMYKISLQTNRVYITERKSFCSNFCFKASKYVESQISDSPVLTRIGERAGAGDVLLGRDDEHGNVSLSSINVALKPLQWKILALSLIVILQQKNHLVSQAMVSSSSAFDALLDRLAITRQDIDQVLSPLSSFKQLEDNENLERAAKTFESSEKQDEVVFEESEMIVYGPAN